MRRAIMLFLALDVVMAVLYLLDMALGSPYSWMTWFVNVNLESNLPTWWSVVQLFTAGLLLSVFTFHRFRLDDRRTWSSALLPGPLLLLSLDEGSRLHEEVGRWGNRLSPGVRVFFDAHHMHSVWMLVMFVIAVASMWAIWAGTRHYFHDAVVVRRFLIGFAVLFTAAVGFEVFLAQLGGTGTRTLEFLFEEFFEMVGGTILVWAAASFLESHGIRVSVTAAPPAETGGQAPG